MDLPVQLPPDPRAVRLLAEQRTDRPEEDGVIDVRVDCGSLDGHFSRTKKKFTTRFFPVTFLGILSYLFRG